MAKSGLAARLRRKKPRLDGAESLRLEEQNAAGGMPASQLYGGNLERQGAGPIVSRGAGCVAATSLACGPAFPQLAAPPSISGYCRP
jgi:hypothetical protein